MFTWKAALVCSILMDTCMGLKPTERSPFFEATFPTEKECMEAVTKDVISVLGDTLPDMKVFIKCERMT